YFFFQAEDGIRDRNVTGVQTCALPISFACFLTRAYDFIRMAAISGASIKLMGSHVGVSIGEDGPSQMGLEDLAMMAAQPGVVVRSEERRVGKECRGRGGWEHGIRKQ